MFKMLIIGESGVGKTCILLRFADGRFEENALSTIGVDFRIREMTIDGKRVKLQIWDSAGQERFRNITVSYYRNCSGIIIVYDISTRDTFEKVSEWVHDVRGRVPDTVQLLLVGNKADLEDAREVPREEAAELANRLEMKFVEASAKTNEGIDEVFTAIARDLIAAQGQTTGSLACGPTTAVDWGIDKDTKKHKRGCC